MGDKKPTYSKQVIEIADFIQANKADISFLTFAVLIVFARIK